MGRCLMKFGWPDNLIDGLEWVGTITGIGAALVVSSNMGYIGIGYTVFLISAVCILYVALKLERWGLFTMSIGYILINLWGIWRWLLEPMIA